MGEPQTPHFYDFGTFEQALSSLNQVLDFSKEIKKSHWNVEKQYYSYKSQNPEKPFLPIWTRRAPNNGEYPFNKILEILDMVSISIKHMEWKFGNM